MSCHFQHIAFENVFHSKCFPPKKCFGHLLPSPVAVISPTERSMPLLLMAWPSAAQSVRYVLPASDATENIDQLISHAIRETRRERFQSNRSNYNYSLKGLPHLSKKSKVSLLFVKMLNICCWIRNH